MHVGNTPSPCSRSTKTRRQWMQSVLATTLVITTSTSTVSSSNAVDSTSSGLFAPNPLTNRVLEQLRIWDQDAADNYQYNGELQSPSERLPQNDRSSYYGQLLVPILQMAQELQQAKSYTILSSSPNDNPSQTLESWKQALSILQQSKYDKIAFKKVFNAFGDNIYYSDPDRANLYLGGGATPKSEQSLAYLLRNDILTNIEDWRAELEYQCKQPPSSPYDTEDLYQLAQAANKAMDKYLTLVPPVELQKANELFRGQKPSSNAVASTLSVLLTCTTALVVPPVSSTPVSTLPTPAVLSAMTAVSATAMAFSTGPLSVPLSLSKDSMSSSDNQRDVLSSMTRLEEDTNFDRLRPLLCPSNSTKVDQMSVSDLAYIGDAVYELLVRSYMVWPSKRTSELQQQVVSLVRAEHQATLLAKLKEPKSRFVCTEKELQLLSRGRNSVKSKVRIGKDPQAYQDATALETLIGYLYVTDSQRCAELLQWIQGNLGSNDYDSGANKQTK